MTRSSPKRRSLYLASADSSYVSQFLTEDRNSEGSHRDALLAAQEEHRRVRDAAVRVYELHELESERKRIEEEERIEEKRIEAERAIVQEQLRLRELKRTVVPRPPPEPPTPEPVAPTEARAPQPPPAATPAPAPQPTAAFQPTKAAAAPVKPAPSVVATKPTPAPQPQSQLTAAPLTNGFQPTPAPTSAPAKRSYLPDFQEQINARYVEIHRQLKQLRSTMKAEARKDNTVLKANVGRMRREIGKSVGQLTASGIRGENKQQVRFKTDTLGPQPRLKSAATDALAD